MNTDKIKLLEVDLQIFAYSGYGNKKANPQDDLDDTYVDDSGVVRYSGSNNRVGGSVNTNKGAGISTTYESPKNGVKATTAQTKGGNTYTFAGDNWVEYAKQNGITDDLSWAITAPSYVNANEANRFLNENITLYGGGKIPTTDLGAGIYDYISNDEAAAYKAGNNYYSNNNGVTTMQGYTPLGTYNDSGIKNTNHLNDINYYKNQYAIAQANGDKAGMEAAHKAAEAIRQQYGYSGGIDGSGYFELGYGLTNTPDSGDFYWNVERPTYNYNEPQPTFTSNYDDTIKQLLNDILTREDFSYDVNSDPLYQQMKSQYLREGQRAMNDTLASAAAGAGGMNSYAIGAANQAQNYYNAQLGDIIPELYNLAYDKWLDNFEMKVDKLGLVQQMDDTEYKRYLDTLDNWRNDRDFAYGKYTDDMGYWGNDRDFAYGMFQDDIARDQWQQKFDYEANRDAVADSNDAYDKAYNQAMEFLSMGIMPSADILAKAGISATEAQAYIAKVVAASTKSTGGGDDDNGYTPVTGDPTPTPAPKPSAVPAGVGGYDYSITGDSTYTPKEYETWGGSDLFTDSYYSVSGTLRRMSNRGSSKDEMAEYLASCIGKKINSAQAAKLQQTYGLVKEDK